VAYGTTLKTIAHYLEKHLPKLHLTHKSLNFGELKVRSLTGFFQPWTRITTSWYTFSSSHKNKNDKKTNSWLLN